MDNTSGVAIPRLEPLTRAELNSRLRFAVRVGVMLGVALVALVDVQAPTWGLAAVGLIAVALLMARLLVHRGMPPEHERRPADAADWVRPTRRTELSGQVRSPVAILPTLTRRERETLVRAVMKQTASSRQTAVKYIAAFQAAKLNELVKLLDEGADPEDAERRIPELLRVHLKSQDED